MTYSIQDIIDDGSFIESDKLKKIIKKLRVKKNLILQGPPSSGKSWLAKRLAYALVGEQDTNKVSAIQFHKNLRYGDFVRKLRRDAEEGSHWVSGPFMNMIDLAKKDSSSSYVLIIEEIDRGNPSHIFGDMITLLDAEKREKSDALILASIQGMPLVYIPENLYIIGTRNNADQFFGRKDLALRRRFAYVDLVPEFNELWQKCFASHDKFDLKTIVKIKDRINKLNDIMLKDAHLGRKFQFGYSIFTPPKNEEIYECDKWFFEIIEEEVIPLIEEFYGCPIEVTQGTFDFLTEKF